MRGRGQRGNFRGSNREGTRGGSPARGGRGGQRGGFSHDRQSGDRGGHRFEHNDRGRGDRGDRGGFRNKNDLQRRQPQRNQHQNTSKTYVDEPTIPGVYMCHAADGIHMTTKSSAPGISVYNERVFTIDSANGPTEYREWNPFRSKIGAFYMLQGPPLGFGEGSSVLYLGASVGTTVSHVSDIVTEKGRVYAVEFSHHVARDLLRLAEGRSQIVPIIEDARYPSKYRALVPMVDFLFADVAQPDQARILAINAEHFLKSDGKFAISIKATCVDSTIPPEEVYALQREELEKAGFVIEDVVDLSKYHTAHAMFYGTYRPTADA